VFPAVHKRGLPVQGNAAQPGQVIGTFLHTALIVGVSLLAFSRQNILDVAGGFG